MRVSLNKSGRRSILTFLTSLTVLAVPLPAQQRWLPDVAPFDYPLASPRVTGLVARYIRTTVSDNQFGPSTEGEAALGGNVPLVLLRSGPRPISLGFGAEVYGRFNLTDPKSALISNDWTRSLSESFGFLADAALYRSVR